MNGAPAGPAEAPTETPPRRWQTWGTPAVTLAVLAALWPDTLALRSDDFGYIESVTAVIRGGWPGASDWLEPFNHVLPVIGTAVYLGTGSFYAATLGLLFLVAAAYVVLVGRWVRPYLPAGWQAELAIAALVLAPIGLNKLADFTGVSLGWTLTLGALLAWRARSPAWFFALVILGVLNRQSAVCLLALPAGDCLLRWRHGRQLPAVWLAGSLIALVAIAGIAGMTPPNFARDLVARHGAGGPGPGGGPVLLGLGLLGGIAAAWTVLRREGRPAIDRSSPLRLLLPLLWLGGGAAALTLGLDVRCETPALSRYSALGLAGAFGLSALFPQALRRVDPAALGAAVLYTALVAWRGTWWDYYAWDLVLLLAPARPDTAAATARSASVGALALAAWAAVGLLPIADALRQAESGTRACEGALREGRLAVSELSCAPFGFMGWKLFPALRSAEYAGRTERLSDFLKFVEARRSRMQDGAVVRYAPAPERRSLHPSGERWDLPPDYRPRRFPLDDAEWRTWLEAPLP